MISHTMEKAVLRFIATDIPDWGEDEAEIDPPSWHVSEAGSDPALPGGGLCRYPMLYIGEGCNRMSLILDGRVAWTFCAGKGWEYDDVWMMTNGNILFSRMYWAAEVTPHKKLVWRMEAPKGTEIHTLQPIGLDRVMVVLNAAPLPRVMILNKATGVVEYQHDIPYDISCGVHGQFRRFRITAQHTFLAACLSMDRVVEYDLDFHEIWSYEVPSPWAAVRLKNGNTLITDERDGRLLEVDPARKIVWEFFLTELPEQYRLDGSQSCVRLDNGNTILCSRGGEGTTPQLVEITPEHQVVWVLKDWKNLGPATTVQILSEEGIPEKPGDCQR